MTHPEKQQGKSKRVKVSVFSEASESIKYILITKADKRNTTVAMNKHDYIHQATLVLADKKTYEPLKKDPTNTIHNKVNNLIKIWKEKNYISVKIANSLKSSNPLPARFYEPT